MDCSQDSGVILLKRKCIVMCTVENAKPFKIIKHFARECTRLESGLLI